MFDINKNIENLFKFLAQNFWPGALTIIMHANINKISKLLTAGGDFLGVR